ncbi:MAG TPA: 50S ribosomal protein L4 [Geminicoccaceae bacterium]|jgi:large subunit ribosomal protein L4|nr:50S ribosomal protein L4 [Geminicoccaceae bacterium]
MQLAVTTLDQGEAGMIELSPAVFGQAVRADVLHQVVRWQLAKRRQGTHKAKTRGEVNKTTRKMYKQKGTGRARHGAASVPQFRGGGKAFGPTPRDHAIDLPKKVRRLGLKMALSSKLADGKLVILDRAALDQPKTKQLAARLDRLGWSSALLIDGPEFDQNFSRAAQNLRGLQLMASGGANVYDILRRDLLVLTRDAVRQLEERLA